MERNVDWEPIQYLELFLGYVSPGESPRELSDLQIQTGLFLLSQTLPLDQDQAFPFRAYWCGPVSPALFEALRSLESKGLVRARPDAQKKLSWYRPTKLGRERAAALANTAEAREILTHVDVLRGLLLQLSLKQIIIALGAGYPDYSLAPPEPGSAPDSPALADGALEEIFCAEGIKTRVEVLDAMRSVDRGEYITRSELLASLNGR
jgi:hypothetical protein